MVSEQRQGLGFDFKLCADEAITKITRSPIIYKKVFQDVRRVILKRFPFGVYYLVDNDAVIVLAVLHARRDPENWKSRI
ncbi:type II toxin-antitoxin system RelE/ParE family toxin [sulfur-oxidizing endosymbiont of Gigantopelta aegis]|uniref:type II toxin-antitoxin system RelE/ParE family toxin n=1 Tax=sulfur-oxidizing endosymbiont of Gigantopelta aegis TaxID=2794934 RepID=UPI0018DBDC41